MSYKEAKEKYAAYGVDAGAAMERLQAVPISLHCWQGDDVRGFDTDPSKPLTGGIQTTGNYPGRARTPEELMADIDQVLRLIPGTPKLNLHASYAVFHKENGGWVDRDKLEPKHFKPWVDFCRARGLGCDFNPTFFSHPRCDPLTLASPNEETRRFWIDHGRACIRISQYLAQELGQSCTMNIWTGDGFKDIPADRMGPRMRCRQSIDEIREIAREIVRCGGLDGRGHIALDYFDASINRLSAWVTGYRNTQKALLFALLQPNGAWKELQDQGRFTELMVAQEEMKTLPFGDVWEEYCRRCGKPADGQWLDQVQDYEQTVLGERV